MKESGKSATLDLDNMLLLDALQLAPRASWSRIGEVLGITAVTAAKRWARLREGGIAWVTAAPAMASRQCRIGRTTSPTICRSAPRKTCRA